jgi:hypothetical protein
MIAPHDQRTLAPTNLPPPQVSTRGPVRPGDEVIVKLPLRALPQADVRDEVVVNFIADGAAVFPESCLLGSLPAGQSAIAEAKLTVAPLNGHRDVRVWANVEIAERIVSVTDAAVLPIRARSRIVLQASDDGLEVSVRLRNSGEAATPVRLELLGSGVPQSPDIDIAEDRAGRYVTTLFVMPVDGERKITLHDARIDHIIAVAEDGERASVQPERVAAAVSLRIVPQLTIEAPPEGVRRGDLVGFRLSLRNDGAAPIEGLSVALQRVPSLVLLYDTITLDDARVIASDVATHEDVVGINVGRLDAEAIAVLSGSFRVEVENPREIDALPISGTVTAPRLSTTYRFDSEVLVDRRPSFAPTTTYLGPIEPTSDGDFRVRGMITNSERYRIERLRVLFESADAVLDDHVKVDDNRVNLRSTALEESAGLFADFDGIGTGERIEFTLGMRVARGDADFRTLRLRATMQVDDDHIRLGEQEYRVPGHANLFSSVLERIDERPFRLGMPVEARLAIRNTGDSPARDIRLALDMPRHVGASIPEANAGGRWCTIAPMLPPGSEMATTVTFYLKEPAPDAVTRIVASIDAEGFSEIVVGELAFATPSDPLVDPPALQAQPLPDGRIAMLARVANLGDGIAKGVWLHVADGDIIVPRTTQVDGIPVEDLGHRSQLATQLVLGTLEAGAFREVLWHAAPPTDALYRTRVVVGYEGGREMEALSVPTKPRSNAALTTSLPEARRLTSGATAERTPRRTIVRVVEERAEEAGALASQRDARALIAEDTRALAAAPEIPTEPPVPIEALPAATFEVPEPPVPIVPTPPANEVAPDNVVADGGTERVGETLSLAVDPNAPAASQSAPLESEPVVEKQPDPAAEEVQAENAEPVVETQPDAPVEEVQPENAEHVVETQPDAPAEEVEPENSEPVAPVLHADLASPPFQRGVITVRKLLESDAIGWWRHVMTMRILLVEAIPELSGDTAAAYENLRKLVSQPVFKAFPRLFTPDFKPNDEFIDAISLNDEAALEQLDVVLAGTPWISTNAIAQGSARLDHVLPHFLPDTVEDANLDGPLRDYKGSLVRLYGYEQTIALSHGARRSKYSGAPNGTLDERLRMFIEAMDDRS